jgi:hypothetical protein
MFLIVGALCEDEYIEDLKCRAHRIVHFPNGKTEFWLDDVCCVVVLANGSKFPKTRMRIPIPGASSPGGGSGSAGTVAASATASDEWRF